MKKIIILIACLIVFGNAEINSTCMKVNDRVVCTEVSDFARKYCNLPNVESITHIEFHMTSYIQSVTIHYDTETRLLHARNGYLEVCTDKTTDRFGSVVYLNETFDCFDRVKSKVNYFYQCVVYSKF